MHSNVQGYETTTQQGGLPMGLIFRRGVAVNCDDTIADSAAADRGRSARGMTTRLRDMSAPVPAAAAVATAVLVLLVASCSGRSPRTSAGRSAAAVVDEAGSLYGKTVLVTDRVTGVMSATALMLGGSASEGGLLVFGISAMHALDDFDADRSPVGDVVSVEGELRPFDVAEFERLLGELDDSRYEPFDGNPALVADTFSPGKVRR